MDGNNTASHPARTDRHQVHAGHRASRAAAEGQRRHPAGPIATTTIGAEESSPPNPLSLRGEGELEADAALACAVAARPASPLRGERVTQKWPSSSDA